MTRPEPIMVFKLPIKILSNASKFSLSCANYAPLCPIMFYKNDHHSNFTNDILKHTYMGIAI